MNHSKDLPITPADTSAAIGKLIVRLRRDGLISNEDVQRTLREALAPAALAVSASLPRSFPQTMAESSLAAE